jgi:acyl transferase domain-containing protein/3-hydroxymyristoyl/3-hydroxydecanoyl-(acyl carrier protein) dehydratase
MNMKSRAAIVGMNGVFPGAPDLASFWKMLVEGRHAFRQATRKQWPVSPESLLHHEKAFPDKVFSLYGCYVDLQALQLPQLPNLDAAFIDQLDPVFKLGLIAAAGAWQEAQTESIDHSRVKVIIGNIVLPTQATSQIANDWLTGGLEAQLFGQPLRNVEQVDPINRYAAGFPAGLIAHALGLGGGTYTLDAACASSLYALKYAVDEVVTGRADAVITGGLSRPDSLYTQMGFSQLRAISGDSVARPFDQRGSGLVVGEGAGMFVVKRLEDALAHGDHIYATVAGAGLSNDRDGSLLAPSSEGQLRAMRTAYRQANWQPWEVDSIECHATGTPLGDSVEFASLQELWHEATGGTCVLGSVKANIGHLLTAAGAASLCKGLLSMQHGSYTATATFENPAEKIDLANSPFRILKEAEPWAEGSRPRRLGVSAFGFGGINAHLLLEQWHDDQRTKNASFIGLDKPAFSPIAVVGMGAQVGPWQHLDAFAGRVLGADTETVAPTRPNWWGLLDIDSFKEWLPHPPEGFFIDQLELPIGRFRIPPNEMKEMLPQQLLMLLLADAAYRDVTGTHADSEALGVYIGIGLDLNTTNFQNRWRLEETAKAWWDRFYQGRKAPEPAVYDSWLKALKDAFGPALSANRTMGALGGMVASRIAREFRAGGPSLTFSSEETSGMHALQAAIKALQAGEIDEALVGAVDFGGDLRSFLGAQKHRHYADLEHSHPWDASSNGALLSEGGVAFVCKRLEDAERDGDAIYAVLRGVGQAHGGELAHCAANTIKAASESALAETSFHPGMVQFVETGISGDRKSDDAERRALAQVFGESLPAMGSVQADVGHTGAAAGLVSLAKTCLALAEGIIPGIRDLESPDRLDIGEDLAAYPTAPHLWLRNREEGPRCALVQAHSMDGNAVSLVVTAELKSKRQLRHLKPSTPQLFCFRADTLENLKKQLLQQQTESKAMSLDLASQQAWSRVKEQDGIHRLSLIADSYEDLLGKLKIAYEAFQQHPANVYKHKEFHKASRREQIFYSADPIMDQGQVAFVFPGSGSHYPEMGRDLATFFPEIFDRQDAETVTLRKQYVPEMFWNPKSAHELNEHLDALLIGQVALGTAMHDLAVQFNIQPRGIIGYSLGETAGFTATRTWRDRDSMYERTISNALFTEHLGGRAEAVRKTWRLNESEQVDWQMGVINQPEEQVRAALKKLKRVYLLIVNTPEECVIGGDGRQIQALVEQLGCRYFPIHGVIAVHCEVLKPVADIYRNHHLYPTTPPEGVRFYSGARGASYEVNRETAADAILAQAIEGVHFPKTIEKAYADGYRIFVEMGPGGSCSRMIRRILGSRPHIARSICVPGDRSFSNLLRLLGDLYVNGVDIDLLPLWSGKAAPRDRADKPVVKLPVAQERIIAPDWPEAPQPVEPQPEEIVEDIPVKQAPTHTPVQTPAPTAAVQTETPTVAVTLTASPVTGQAEWLDPHQKAHEVFLRMSQASQKSMADLLSMQNQLLAQGATPQAPTVVSDPVVQTAPPQPVQQEVPAVQPQLSQHPGPKPANQVPESWLYQKDLPGVTDIQRNFHPDALYDRDVCMRFAVGRMEEMFGEEFAEADQYPTRVRLPDEPLMLADRIMSISGEHMSHGNVVTEHDVLEGLWYLDCNRIPTCIAVEAGQADLLLSGFLGIDKISKGLAVYRLLDATVTFHDELPGPGKVIRYDIRIESFFRQGSTYLFRFAFDGTVDGKPLLTMRNGVAGFFTQKELDDGKGIVEPRQKPPKRQLPADWHRFINMPVTSYTSAQVDALRRGDLVSAFGQCFAGLPLQEPETIPGGLMNLVHRVTELDPNGGRYGIGTIVAEADIHPDDWFLLCHFCDDRVMPGTLMYECCLHTLRIFLLRMGWVGERGQIVYQPIPEVKAQLKCRGQVLETSKTVRYQIFIKEMGYRPEPYVIADALMYADDKPIVEIVDMNLRMSGTDLNNLKQLWSTAESQQAREAARLQQDAFAQPAVYTKDQILAYAIGKPSEGFGEQYIPYDQDRVLARLPGPPFLFVDRIVYTSVPPWQLKAGGSIVAQYDIPKDAWYFAANNQPEMPFVVLLEIALQPCGWFAAYMGSALHGGDADLRFRNLGGEAIQHRPIDANTGTIAIEVHCTAQSASGGMVIQHFTFDVKDAQGSLYTGKTYFGFFSDQALAEQIGVRGVTPYQLSDADQQRALSFAYPKHAPYANDELSMIDHISAYLPEGGPSEFGFIEGTKPVDPSAWFFQAHFYQDPVIPGSLGLESFLQLLKVFAAERWGLSENPIFETPTPATSHEWIYRGQVIPQNKLVRVQAVITAINDETRSLTADGFLIVDDLIIYQMKAFTISIKG